MKNNFKLFMIAVILCIIALCTIVFADDLDELQNRKSNLQNQITDANEQISDIQIELTQNLQEKTHYGRLRRIQSESQRGNRGRRFCGLARHRRCQGHRSVLAEQLTASRSQRTKQTPDKGPCRTRHVSGRVFEQAFELGVQFYEASVMVMSSTLISSTSLF